MKNNSIKTIIFDLGGVILDLSVEHTLQSFSELSGLDKAKVKALFHQAKGFEDYEKGLISDDVFRSFVRETYRIQASDQELDASWNAMLRGIPSVKLELLLRLKKDYQVVLLSNTNTIHLSYVNDTLMPAVSGQHLEQYFHRTYYSHYMKKRKPDAEIFQQVLDENRLDPAHTLFLDDNADNVAGARALGIQTVHVTSPELILDYFHA